MARPARLYPSSVGRTAVGQYIQEHREVGGILRPALHRGPVKKSPCEVAPKSKMQDGETLYDYILGRTSVVNREGSANTSRNFHRYRTVEENGPYLHGVSVRLFRGKLRKMGISPA